MASNTVASASTPQEQHGEAAAEAYRNLEDKLTSLKIQIQNERIESIKEKLQRNKKNLQHQLLKVTLPSLGTSSLDKVQNNVQILSSRIGHPLCKMSGFSQGLGKDSHTNKQDVSLVKSIKIPSIKKLPRYTFWIPLARNERMAEDQSVIGKRNVYYVYDRHGGETVIGSDSDEEFEQHEEVIHVFSHGEDQILRAASEEHGLTEEVLSIVRRFIRGTSSKIQERYKNLKEKDQLSEDFGEHGSHTGMCLDRSLSAALDTFDHLFCRQCMIYECPLHSCTQPLIYPSEKQPVWSEPEGDRKPCSDHCYLLLKDVAISSKNSSPGSFQDRNIKIVEEIDGILAPADPKELGNQSTRVILQKETRNSVTTPITEEVDCHGDPNSNVPLSENMGKQKVSYMSDSVLCYSTFPPDESQNSRKKLKMILETKDTTMGDFDTDINLDSCKKEKDTITCASLKYLFEHASNKLIVSGSTCHSENDKGVDDRNKAVTNKVELELLSNSTEKQVDELASISHWKSLEKELYLKGIEMFGRNSCLIYRNLLSGLKTCMEVATYMHAEVSRSHKSMDGNRKFDDHEISSRSGAQRRKGKARKFKYSSKSAGLSWKRVNDGTNQTRKQYTPCGCKGMCQIDCPCSLNKSHCEKYCGCSKICKYRFRGCHCAKSQCRSRHCPCFAASRECDPDVCRNCWVSCGGGMLGEPPRHGNGQCQNMMILSRQKQRILLAKSDTAGWGAFLKNPANKNDYLGEYTGELVSQIEADKRGKLYDRADVSFLFALNDQYVIDAYRKGDKLKFANHSSKPNCYAKIMLVAGDHRVGIFAQERIEAGEELFYNYHYGPNHRPSWMLKNSVNGSKRNESTSSQGKAKKYLSD